MIATGHPLFDEKEELKRKYVALIKKYAEKYEIEEKRRSDLQMLQQAMFGMIVYLLFIFGAA